MENSKEEALNKLIKRGMVCMMESKLSYYEMEQERKEKERVLFEATYGEFNLWADDYFTKDKLNTYVDLRAALSQFRKDTPFKWNIKYFKENLEEWCEAKKYEVDPPESIGSCGKCHDDLERGYKPTVFIKPIKTENNV